MRPSLPLRSLALATALLCGCGKGSYDPTDDLRPPEPPKALPEDVDFQLRAEFDGPCEAKSTIDVNLGNAPEAFVRAASCQISGAEPGAEVVKSWSDQLR